MSSLTKLEKDQYRAPQLLTLVFQESQKQKRKKLSRVQTHMLCLPTNSQRASSLFRCQNTSPSHQANLHPLQSAPDIPSDAPHDLTPTLSHHCKQLRSSCDSTVGANEETDSPWSTGLGAPPPLPCCWAQRAYREVKCTIFATNVLRAIFCGASFYCPCSSSALVGPGY